LGSAAATVAEITNPESQRADDLRRQINDGQGLNRLARTELRMRRVMVGWYKATVEALKEYPSLIRDTATEMKVGLDVLDIALDRWHEFERNTSHFLIEELKKTCETFIFVAAQLQDRRRRPGSAMNSTVTDDEFNFEIARGMILAGRQPPAHWIPSIVHLDFGTRRIFEPRTIGGANSPQVVDAR
jgi:hypothetical protein